MDLFLINLTCIQDFALDYLLTVCEWMTVYPHSYRLVSRHGIFPVLTWIQFFHLHQDHSSKSSSSGLIFFAVGGGGRLLVWYNDSPDIMTHLIGLSLFQNSRVRMSLCFPNKLVAFFVVVAILIFSSNF